jgi:hypothetical protein
VDGVTEGSASFEVWAGANYLNPREGIRPGFWLYVYSRYGLALG